MPQRTIQSPGVQINEVDLSQIAVTPTGTNVLVAGYAPQGPTYEIVELASLSEFQTVFGTPTNAAERYFYYSVQQLFNAGGNPTIQAVRIPYGTNTGDGTASNYSALAFPVIAIPSAPGTYPTSAQIAGTIPLSSASGYYFGEPALVTLTPEQYTTIQQGGLSWSTTTGNVGLSSFVLNGNGVVNSLSAAGMIVINEGQSTINESFQGYYLNISDTITNNPATNFDDVVSVKSINSSYFTNTLGSDGAYTVVPQNSIGFTLSATYTSNINSISQVVEQVPTFNVAASGQGDMMILSLFKLRPSPFSPNTTTLQYVLQEGYAGSLYSNRTQQDKNGGTPNNIFLPTLVNPSTNLQIYVNPNISNYTNWLDQNGNSTKRVRIFKNSTLATMGAALTSDPDYTFYTSASAYLQTAVLNPTFTTGNSLYAFGNYADSIPLNSAKVIGNVPAKVQYVLNAAANPQIVPLDITVDAGLSTIWASVNTTGATEFDDTYVNTTLLGQVQALSASNGSPVSNTLISSWNNVTSLFQQFAQYQRKDHVFISDPLRYIFVTGQNYKTLNNINYNFSQNVYWPLNNCYSQFNSNYCISYANWVQAQDTFTGQNVWLPFSGYAAAMITASDANNQFWTAPAGLNRGVITGISDIGINPLQKQRDLLYNISLNPVVYYPGEGYIVMGQKTLQTTPTAFDRINVRRLFLYLEKAVNSTVKYFVFEPNTTFTRSRIVNTIAPIFDQAKNTQGLYDYLIVCNATNNTPTVIDDNSLVVDIYIKPVRTAEFILVNFYATKTSQNFSELTA